MTNTSKKSMPRITKEQKEEVLHLYKEKGYSIIELMKITGVKSSQTIYRILDGYSMPRIRAKKSAGKVYGSLDEETNRLLEEANPKNVSAWVCKMIQKGCRRSDNDTTIIV